MEFFTGKTSEENIDCGDDFSTSLEAAATESFLKDWEQPVIICRDIKAIWRMCRKLDTILLDPLCDQSGFMLHCVILVKHLARFQFWVFPAGVLFQFL